MLEIISIYVSGVIFNLLFGVKLICRIRNDYFKRSYLIHSWISWPLFVISLSVDAVQYLTKEDEIPNLDFIKTCTESIPEKIQVKTEQLTAKQKRLELAKELAAIHGPEIMNEYVRFELNEDEEDQRIGLRRNANKMINNYSKKKRI